jgi:hypothetical protein
MPDFQPNLPGCCSVGIMMHHDNDNRRRPVFLNGQVVRWENLPPSKLPAVTSTSNHFIAIFARHQKAGYDEVCKKHDLLACVKAKGGHTNADHLAICVFRKGKKT